jgi:hypothetical protein
MKNVKPLKPAQLTAIQMLAVGTPASHVAEKLDVSAMTIYRWQRIPEFEAKLTSITSSGLEQVSKTLNSAALTAAETLQEILCDMSQPVPIRMRAALGVLGVLGPVNSALERGLQHRVGDFDLAQRFHNQAGYSYEAGQSCNSSAEHTITV